VIPSAAGRATAGPDLGFEIAGARPMPSAASPSLAFDLRVAEASGVPVRSLLLHAQVRIQAPRRRYSEAERARLGELFGRPEQWSESLRSLFWTSVTVLVPPFSGSSTAEILVPVTYDFDVTATKYLQALDDGVIPLEFLFSGTAFYEDGGRLQVTRISWDKEATFALPLATWRATLEAFFPNTAWLRVDREIFERLWRHRVEHNLPSWDLALRHLLDGTTSTTAMRAPDRQRGADGVSAADGAPADESRIPAGLSGITAR
jgi:hypothetical protein